VAHEKRSGRGRPGAVEVASVALICVGSRLPRRTLCLAEPCR